MIPTPAIARIMQRMMPVRTYQHVSKRSWKLAQGSTRQERAALYEPSDITRILGVAQESTLRQQMERIQGGVRKHGPTTAHLIRNAQLCDGHVVRPTVSHRVSADPMPWFHTPFKPRIERAILASTSFGVRYFGHWLLDDMPMTLAAKKLGEAINVTPQLSRHQGAYAKLLGTTSRTVMNANVQELIIIDDSGQNDYKADRLEELRNKLLRSFPKPQPSKVMLLRKDTGSSRLLVNEMALAERLASQGFRIISPMESSVDDIVQACLGASVVVGVEGSHLSHAVLSMPPGSTLLTIQPPDRFDAALKDWCDCKQVRFAFTVGELSDEGGFRASEHQIDRLLQNLP